jgi:hypothetical protein
MRTLTKISFPLIGFQNVLFAAATMEYSGVQIVLYRRARQKRDVPQTTNHKFITSDSTRSHSHLPVYLLSHSTTTTSMMRYLLSAILVQTAVFSTCHASYIPKVEVPDGDWVSYASDVEFLSANHQDQAAASVLARQLASSSVYDSNPYSADRFVEGESNYDEYQQAWRSLGFFIDCDNWSHWSDDDNNEGGGSGDAGTEDGCRRYVLWAAYIDLDYEGGGIGEYQFWNRNKNKWDSTACNIGGQSSRCAKMDCHLQDTHWSLLGFFKHKSPNDWMEQLFKHEGVCVWTEEEYSFMSSARKAWPQGCIESSATTSSGKPIYYSTKPVSGGSITLGLYTDTKCVTEYTSTFVTVENVLGNLLLEGGSGSQDNSNYDGYSLAKTLSLWDSAMDAFKICQPCVAYDLNNYGYNTDDDSSRGSTYGTYTYGYDDDYSQNNNKEADFDCYDDAGYTNVNQCMKFAAKTYMDTATIRDVALAARQGTLCEVLPMEGLQVGSSSSNRMFSAPKGFDVFSSILFLVVSCGVLVYGVVVFRKARKDANYAPNWSMKEPLVFA